MAQEFLGTGTNEAFFVVTIITFIYFSRGHRLNYVNMN